MRFRISVHTHRQNGFLLKLFETYMFQKVLKIIINLNKFIHDSLHLYIFRVFDTAKLKNLVHLNITHLQIPKHIPYVWFSCSGSSSLPPDCSVEPPDPPTNCCCLFSG